MSQENVEVVRKLYEACVRDDFDEALTHCDRDVVYKPAQEAAAHGADAVRARLCSAWERKRRESRASAFRAKQKRALVRWENPPSVE